MADMLGVFWGADSVHPGAKPGDAKNRARTRLMLLLANAHNVLLKLEQDIQTMARGE